MHKWMILVLLLFSAPLCQGQYASRFDISSGYTYVLLNPSAGGHLNFNGWNATSEVNINRHFGIAADFTGTYASQSATSLHMYSFLGGPVVKMHSEGVTAFVHALGGGVLLQTSALGQSADQTKPAIALGGGIDYQLGKRVSLRLLQADYLLTRFSDKSQNNVRLSFGIVFHLATQK